MNSWSDEILLMLLLIPLMVPPLAQLFSFLV